jgi:hypothetical protein
MRTIVQAAFRWPRRDGKIAPPLACRVETAGADSVPVDPCDATRPPARRPLILTIDQLRNL